MPRSRPRHHVWSETAGQLDRDLVRFPAGEVPGWRPGQKLDDLQLSRSRLRTFPGLHWEDVQPDSGGMAEAIQVVCRRCAAALAPRRRKQSRWSRTDPRP